jgi:hypothetical protein
MIYLFLCRLTTAFGKGFHSLSLGKADGSGLHRVTKLMTPVVMLFEVALPEVKTTNVTTNETTTMTPQCQSWDIDKEGDEGSSSPYGGCAVTVFNGTAHETTTMTPQCLYWDVDEGEWSTEGCTLTFFNGTHMECSCDHLTDFATAFQQVARSADFQAFTRVQLITVENMRQNPLPFILLFLLYFLAGMGVILGAKLDAASSKNIQSDRIPDMLMFDSYRDLIIAFPLSARLIRTTFIMANVCLLLLAIALVVCGSITLDSTFNWIFGNLGNVVLIGYAVTQCGMVLLGLYLIGMIPSKGLHRTSLAIWIVLGIVLLLLNSYGLTLALQGEVHLPNMFCPGMSAGIITPQS